MWAFDVVVGTVTVLASTLLIHRFAACPIATLLDKDGTAIYGAILSTAGALLGFVIASITIVQGLISTRAFVDLRRSSHYEDFWLAFIWSIRSLGLTAGVAFAALFISHLPMLWPYVCIVVAGCTIISIVSLGRAIRTLESLLASFRDTQRANDAKRLERVTQYDDP